MDNQGTIPLVLVVYPTNLQVPGVASSLANWMSLPDVVTARTTAAMGAKPFATVSRTYHMEKYYALNTLSFDPNSISKAFVSIQTNPTFTCNLLGIVTSVDETVVPFKFCLRINMEFTSEMAGRL